MDLIFIIIFLGNKRCSHVVTSGHIPNQKVILFPGWMIRNDPKAITKFLLVVSSPQSREQFLVFPALPLRSPSCRAGARQVWPGLSWLSTNQRGEEREEPFYTQHVLHLSDDILLF